MLHKGRGIYLRNLNASYSEPAWPDWARYTRLAADSLGTGSNNPRHEGYGSRVRKGMQYVVSDSASRHLELALRHNDVCRWK